MFLRIGFSLYVLSMAAMSLFWLASCQLETKEQIMHLEVINPVCDLSPQSTSIVYINFLDRTSLFYQKLKKQEVFSGNKEAREATAAF